MSQLVHVKTTEAQEKARNPQRNIFPSNLRYKDMSFNKWRVQHAQCFLLIFTNNMYNKFIFQVTSFITKTISFFLQHRISTFLSLPLMVVCYNSLWRNQFLPPLGKLMLQLTCIGQMTFSVRLPCSTKVLFFFSGRLKFCLNFTIVLHITNCKISQKGYFSSRLEVQRHVNYFLSSNEISSEILLFFFFTLINPN